MAKAEWKWRDYADEHELARYEQLMESRIGVSQEADTIRRRCTRRAKADAARKYANPSRNLNGGE